MSRFPTVSEQQEAENYHLWKEHSITVSRHTLCELLNSDHPTREQLSNWLYKEHSVLKSEYVIQPTYSSAAQWDPAWEIRFAHPETYSMMVLGGILAPK